MRMKDLLSEWKKFISREVVISEGGNATHICGTSGRAIRHDRSGE